MLLARTQQTFRLVCWDYEETGPRYVVILKNLFSKRKIDQSIKCVPPTCKLHANEDWERMGVTGRSVHEAVSTWLKGKARTGAVRARGGRKEKTVSSKLPFFLTFLPTQGSPNMEKWQQSNRTLYSRRERGPGHIYMTCITNHVQRFLLGPLLNTKEMFSPGPKLILCGSIHTAVKTPGTTFTRSEALLGKSPAIFSGADRMGRNKWCWESCSDLEFEKQEHSSWVSFSKHCFKMHGLPSISLQPLFLKKVKFHKLFYFSCCDKNT